MATKATKAEYPYIIGAKYLFRTVTYYWTGRVVAVGPQEIVIDDAAWIADTGRFADAIKSGVFDEVEPVSGNVIIGRGAIVDVCEFRQPLPRVQK